MFEFITQKPLNAVILVLLIIAVIILVREIFLKVEPVAIPEFKPTTEEVKIDFTFLESEELKNILLFGELEIPEEYGRDNPFVAY